MQLAGESRIHVGKAKSLPLGPISYSHHHQVEKPTVQLSTSSFADVFLLGLRLEMQVLEDQDGVHRSPLTELSSGFLTERPVSIMVFPGQPFQHSTDTPRVPVLCLLPGKFGLKSGTNLARLGIANGQSLATNEQGFLVGGSDQGVVYPEVDADRGDSPGLGSLKGDTEESFAPSDTKTVNTLGSVKVLAEVFGNAPADFLSTLKCGDGQASVSAELEVLGVEKKRRRSTEDERASCWFAVGFGRSIGGSSCSNGIAAHLRSQDGLDFVVDRVMQFKGSQRSSAVEADWADGLLVAVELQHGLIDESVLVEDYRYGSLDIHTGSIVIHSVKVNSVLKRNLNQERRAAIPLPVEAGSLRAVST